MGKNRKKSNRQLYFLISGILTSFFMALIAGIVINSKGSSYVTPGIPVHLMTFFTMAGAIIIAIFINTIFRGLKKKR